MPKTMKAIQERLTRLEGLMGWIPENEDRSFHDKVELAMDIVEKVVGQYVKLVAETGQYGSWQAVEEELSVLRKTITNAARGVGSSKTKVPKPKPFIGTRISKDLENFL